MNGAEFKETTLPLPLIATVELEIGEMKKAVLKTAALTQPLESVAKMGMKEMKKAVLKSTVNAQPLKVIVELGKEEMNEAVRKAAALTRPYQSAVFKQNDHAFNLEGQVLIDSRDVAEALDVEHSHLIKDILSLECDDDFFFTNFIRGHVCDGRKIVEKFDITYEGFNLIAADEPVRRITHYLFQEAWALGLRRNFIVGSREVAEILGVKHSRIVRNIQN
ncbi:hypothetical protein ABNF65_24170, partial [Paenibacillus larvae]